MLDTWISVADDADGRRAESLLAWLRDDRHVRNSVDWAPRRSGPDYLGAVVDIVVAGLGSGGAAVALINSLKSWFEARRTEVSVEVRTVKGHVTVTAHNLSDDQLTRLLERILRDDNKPAA
jgi:hypothetical protein